MDRIQKLKNKIYSVINALFCCTILLTVKVSAQVVINEVMARPSDESEWVELYNRSPDAVHLSGWTLSDLRTTGQFEAGAVIDGGGYVIVAQDAEAIDLQYPDLDVPILSLTRWPRLNNGGDGLILRDATATRVDSIFYPAQATAISLERIDLTVVGDQNNWLDSQDPRGATPGTANSVRFNNDVAKVSVVVEPNPFIDQVAITYRMPSPRLHANLWVFDRTGRRVASLLESIESGSQRIVNWDGRNDNGQILKPGIYVIYLEAGTPEGELFRARKPVVLAKGISQ
ncbi:MAG: lamin tail domain-containing protein [Gemmatimonadetes bacterium]|nr:lamin tail domain-containing protein [Gemmatimonadota bacterium]